MFILLVFVIDILFLIIGLFLLQNKSKVSYFGAFSIVLSMSIPLLYFTPNPVVDLSRYFEEMNYMVQYNNIRSLFYAYNDVLSPYNTHGFTFLYDIFQWLISKTGFFNLLPFLSVLIVYLCLFTTFINLRNEYNIPLLIICYEFLSILVLFTYDGTSSTVRWYLASGIFFFVTYLYFRHNDILYHIIILILYIPLIFVHEAIILPVLLMIACTFIKKMKWHQVIIFIALFIMAFVLVGSSNATGNTNYIGITKIYENMSFSAARFSSFLPALRMILSIFVPFMYSIIAFNTIHVNNRNVVKKVQPEINSFIMFNVMDLLLIPFMVIFQRYVLFVGMFDIILIMEIQRYHGHMNDISRKLYFFTIFLGVVYFVMGLHGMNFDFSHLIFES